MSNQSLQAGSPNTLLCTTNRAGYKKRCDQYEADIRSFGELARVISAGAEGDEKRVARLLAACTRAAGWTRQG